MPLLIFHFHQAKYHQSAQTILTLCGFIARRRNWQSTPVLLPGKFHGWRSQVGCSPSGHKESEMTVHLHFLSFYSSFWKRKWQPIPVFLPRESCGQRGLVGYSLWGCREPTLQCRGHQFDPWSRRIPHDSKQLSLRITTTEPAL